MSTWQSLLSRVLGELFSNAGAVQRRRLLQLQTNQPQLSLVVEQAQWRENVNGYAVPGAQKTQALTPLLAVIDCLSPDAHLELKQFLGEPMTLRVMTADGAYRSFHGHIVRAAQLGSDGGFARYRLQLAAFTHFLNLRRDSRLFLGLKADEIVSRVLSAYPQANFRFELSPDTLEAAPVRGTTTQYRETDAAFVERLLSEEGWNWRLDQEETGHTLVISDALAERPDLGLLRVGRPDLRGASGLAEDTLTALAHEHRLQPNAVTLGSWDPRQLAGVSAQAQATPGPAQPPLEIYEGHGHQRFARFQDGEDQPDRQLAEAQAERDLARHHLARQSLHGEGAVRTLRAGATFRLAGSSFAALLPDEHLVLAIDHQAANNLGAEAAQLLHTPELESGSYRQTFRAVPARLTLVPPAVRKPTAPGVQTALVVGHPDQTLSTERNLRVKIQFPWQRGENPVPGGLNAPRTPGQEPTGHAPGNASASQWVRVAQASAGANWGSVFLPRIGTEVVVDFLDGDIDRPVITGQLYNGQDRPPFAAGVDSGANHPGTISGWHSQSHDPLGQSPGFNQWVIDDAPGQLRMRLASQSSGSPWSELSLGHVIQQLPTSSQRGAWLGSGFLAHTAGWASLRAAQGLLLSSTAREGTYGSAEGTQMDAREAVAQLHGAKQLVQALSDVSGPQGALPVTTKALDRVLEDIDPAQSGQHPTRKKAKGRQDSDPVETFAAPHIVLDTPSAAVFASPATIASFSGEDTSLVAQGDIHLAAAHTASFVSGQTTSLYTHTGELQAIAANGPLSLRAHTDALELLADDSMTIVSVNGEITVTAKRIELVGGDSSLVLDGGDITYTTPGVFKVQSASHGWGKGSNSPGQVEALPQGLVGQPVKTLALDYHYADMKPVANAPYVVRFNDGTVRTGTLDAQGHAEIQNPPTAGQVFFGFDGRPAQPRDEQVQNESHGLMPASPEEAQKALARYVAAEDDAIRDRYFPDEGLPGSESGYEDQINDYAYALEVHPPEHEEAAPDDSQTYLLDEQSLKGQEA